MNNLQWQPLFWIFRHAKKVNEQHTRDKILGGEKSSVTTASVSPLVATTSKQSKFSSTLLFYQWIVLTLVLVVGLSFLGIKIDENIDTEAMKKPPRRVLPEHEGRYKITLPSGSTERSKQILAKKAMCRWNFHVIFCVDFSFHIDDDWL